MTKPIVQVIRRGAETWDVNRVTRLWDANSHEYELLGRVIGEGGLYYIDVPEWRAEGYEWKRRPRGYLLPKAAFRALCAPVITSIT